LQGLRKNKFEEIMNGHNEIYAKIFSLFQVQLEGLRKNKIEFMIQGNQQTTTIDKWPYYEFEDYINLLNKRNEEEKKQREVSEKNQGGSSNNTEYRKMMDMAKNFKPGNYKPPNMNIPR
jgi:hypothetical protein